MAKSKTLRELFIVKLQHLYDVESELVDALPKMAEGAKDASLKTAFEDHLEETKEQKERIETIFDLLEEEPTKHKSEAIRGLIADGEWMMKNSEEGAARDTALIAAARAVEHYEMANYMGAQEWAEMLADEGVSSLLEKTLEEEQAAEEKLSELATQVSERLNSDADEDE